jgi:RNA 2',3'-cyclic 3'-phosphodiesterase
MPRLFTALQIPDDVRNALAQHRGGLMGAHWQIPEDYHITLRFGGDMDDLQTRAWFDELAMVSIQPFGITVRGFDAFGGDKPRTLVAKIENNKALQQLQSAHERAARHAGLAPETRKFTPHITLARLHRVSSFEVAELLEHREMGVQLCFEVKSFALMSARPQTGGGPYRVEHIFGE